MQGLVGGTPVWSVAGSVISPIVQAKASPNLCSAQGYPARAIKQSEMAATCAWLGDSQAKPSCESRLAAANGGRGATY